MATVAFIGDVIWTSLGQRFLKCFEESKYNGKRLLSKAGQLFVVAGDVRKFAYAAGPSCAADSNRSVSRVIAALT